MSQTTLTVLIVAVIAVILIVAIVAAASRGRRQRLRDLPPESRDRYLTAWQAVEAKFIESPADAVREADRVAVGVLSERGAALHDDRGVPDDLRRAREAAASDKGRQGTEGMREAMVHYKRIVEDGVGGTSRTRDSMRGREVA